MYFSNLLLNIKDKYSIYLNEDEINKIKNKFTETSISKSEKICSMNEIIDHLYFINSGIVRGYIIDGNSEKTTWFANEGDFFTNAFSFLTGLPSREEIEALENCSLYSIRKNDLDYLYLEIPKLNMLGRKIWEHYYIKLENQMQSQKLKTVKLKYDKFILDHSEIFSRVKLSHIASYLGITNETLSRIRGNYNVSKN